MNILAKDLKPGDRFIWPPRGAFSEGSGPVPEPAYVTVRDAKHVLAVVYLFLEEGKTIWLEADAEMEIDRQQVQ